MTQQPFISSPHLLRPAVATVRFYFLAMLFLLAVLGYLTYKIISPFLIVIAWAVVFSIIFYPLYVFITKFVKIKSVASVVTILVILIMIAGPFTYVAVMLVDEIQIVSAKINENRLGSLQEIVEKVGSLPLVQKIGTFIGTEAASKEEITENLKKIAKGLLGEFPSRITNVISAVFDFVLVLFTTFFLLKDGPGFLSRAKDFMPFSAVQKERLARQIKDLIVSTVYGGVAVSIIQGILGGLAFSVIGMESPILWGVAMSIASFVPLLGTFLIWGPTSAYLVIQGYHVQGIGLFLYGIFVISTVDNILKPLIIGSRTKMPTIIILFSVLGGIKFFGMIGLIMGPLITAVFVSVFDIISKPEEGIESS
jgi:predicted PurR-regulated permease PerM